ncbi:hypothetical protein NIBR502774_14260 (plasmid) [Rhizobium sp. NIBRBAC000502774]|nr:hypothetical protein NIBR502774_14260 [Rhizobium sp. NIBRBAC000502774]
MTFWLTILILALVIGYATNALISTTLMLMDRLIEMPQWIVWYGGLTSVIPAMAASSAWLARAPVARKRYSRGLKLAGWIFLLVIPPFLTLLVVDGTITNPGADGVAGAVTLMAVVVTVWYGLTGGCLLLASRIVSRRKGNVPKAELLEQTRK